MTWFDFLWQLVETHGSVAEFYKAELARVWGEYTLDQQRFIYRSLRDKLRTGGLETAISAGTTNDNLCERIKMKGGREMEHYRTGIDQAMPR